MKTFILLVGIGLALASSSGGKAGRPKHDNEFAMPEKHYPDVKHEHGVAEPEKQHPEVEQENEFVIPEKQYPEVITEFVESVDYSKLSIEELIQLASKHDGLEFLSDANATAAMGIDMSTLSHDLVADALATTVR